MAGYIGSKASVVSSGAERKKVFAITTSTTSLTGLAYTVNQVHVFHNGIRLVDGTDYTATDGTTITLTNAAANGDEVVVVSYAAFQTSDTVSASAGGTFSDAVTVDADGATVLTVDRATSDGTIIDVQKNGSTVGSIGTQSGKLQINGNSGTGFFLDTVQVLPKVNGALADNQADLGSSGYRFNELWLGGGVYLGGVGSANKLDDYEEGTFTPSILGYYGTNPVINYNRQAGSYVKVGNLVHIHIMIDIASASNLGTDLMMIGPLPFAIKSGDEADGISNTSAFSPVRGNHISIGCHSITQSYMGFLTSNNGSSWGWETTSIMSTGSGALRLTMTYRTN